MSAAAPGISGKPSKLITCVIPDDGTDRRLLQLLHDTHGITRADSNVCRGVDVTQAAKARSNKLPEASLARMVNVVVDVTQADAVFDFVCAEAGLEEPGRGSVYMLTLNFATPLEMPANVPPEASAELA